VFQVDTFSISAQVVDLKTLWDLSALGLMMPLMGVDLSALVVLEGTITRRVKSASPLPAARFYFLNIAKKPNIRIGLWSSTLSNFIHGDIISPWSSIYVLRGELSAKPKRDGDKPNKRQPPKDIANKVSGLTIRKDNPANKKAKNSPRLANEIVCS